MKSEYFYKIYNSRVFSFILISLFAISIYSLYHENYRTLLNNQSPLVNSVNDLTSESGMILNAEVQEIQTFEGITPENPPNPEDVKIITEDKIISNLLKITFTKNTTEDLLKNIEKIYTQEITEELKSIEL